MESNEATPANRLNDQLLDLELRIARRADELARTAEPVQDRTYCYWLRGEREVLSG
jgi:hypothetical protein